MTGDPMRTSRDVLYGDVPLTKWAAAEGLGPPWTFFREAVTAIEAGRPEGAIAPLRLVAADQRVEARQRLQAWSALRSLGVTPATDEAAVLEGLVVDVAVDGGLDTLAVYADTSAVYINHTGSAQYVMAGAAYGPQIDAVLAAGRIMQTKIGLWEGPRPEFTPTPGSTRLSLLTAGGLSFGQGPMAVLMTDAIGGPVFQAALALLQAIVATATAAPSAIPAPPAKVNIDSNPLARFLRRFK
jgi:hypothetical protein